MASININKSIDITKNKIVCYDNQFVWSVLLYGCESWTLITNNKND